MDSSKTEDKADIRLFYYHLVSETKVVATCGGFRNTWDWLVLLIVLNAPITFLPYFLGFNPFSEGLLVAIVVPAIQACLLGFLLHCLWLCLHKETITFTRERQTLEKTAFGHRLPPVDLTGQFTGVSLERWEQHARDPEKRRLTSLTLQVDCGGAFSMVRSFVLKRHVEKAERLARILGECLGVEVEEKPCVTVYENGRTGPGTMAEMIDTVDMPDDVRVELEKAFKPRPFRDFFLQIGALLLWLALTIGFMLGLEALFPVFATDRQKYAGWLLFISVSLSMLTIVLISRTVIRRIRARHEKKYRESILESFENATSIAERVDNLLFHGYLDYKDDPKGFADLLVKHRLDYRGVDRAIANAHDEMVKPDFLENYRFGTEDNEIDFDVRDYLTRLLAEIDAIKQDGRVSGQ